MTRENIPEKMDAGSFLKPLISIFSSSFINLSNGLLSPALRWTADQERVLPVVIRAHIHCSNRTHERGNHQDTWACNRVNGKSK